MIALRVTYSAIAMAANAAFAAASAAAAAAAATVQRAAAFRHSSGTYSVGVCRERARTHADDYTTTTSRKKRKGRRRIWGLLNVGMPSLAPHRPGNDDDYDDCPSGGPAASAAGSGLRRRLTGRTRVKWRTHW
jgi:hypothetical protein